MKRIVFILFFISFGFGLSAQTNPTSNNNTVTTLEDNDKVFLAGDFPYNDADADPFSQIRITALESVGILYYDADNDNIIDAGEDVIINQVILVADIPRLKFRPNADDNGAGYDNFDFQVHDGNDGYSILSYTMTIDVTAVNDEPSFTAGVNQIVAEDPGAQNVAGWATAISKGPANEAAQILTFNLSNDNNGLFSVQPDVDEISGDLTYTPAANANGIANVTIWITDDGGTANGGDDTSPSQFFSITVTSVNDAPTGAANTVSCFENSYLTFVTGHFGYNDVEADPFTQIETTTVPGFGTLWIDTDLSGTINGAELPLAAGNSVTVADININRLKFVPVPDENGTPYTTFDFKVHDGTEYSTLSYTMTIDVNSVNSEPSFTAGPDQVVAEDPGAQNVPAWATAINKGAPDEAGQTLTFNLSNDNNGLFSVQPDVDEITGNLTYTPAANANGVANVDIYLTDNGGTANGGDDTSPTQFFSITVNAVNDPPTSAANTVATFENSDYIFILGNFAYADVEADPFIQIETTTVPGFGTLWIDTDLSGTVNGAEVPLAAGNSVVVGDITANLLKFKPLANENGTPYTTFDFKVHDGTEYSTLSYTMTIDVNGINSEPSFTAGPDQVVAEDPGAQNVPAWATAINKGAPDEAGQTLTFNLSNDNNGLFSVQPDVDEITGNLTYTPAANANGVANVDIYLTDDGGTANGGDDTSPTQFFSITVNAVNDPPTSAANTVSVFENNDYVFLIGNFAYADVEADPFIQIETTTVPGFGTLWVDNDSDGTVNGAEVPLAAGNSVVVGDITANLLKFKPVANENGTPYTTFDFKVHDGTEYSTLSYTMTIDVNGINSEPSFTAGPDQVVAEDPGAQNVPAWATAINKGAPDEAGQTLTFNLSNDNNGLFSVQPDVDEITGNLTYTPTADAFGVANVTIYLSDDGGTANGGDDTSPNQFFVITVNPVNDDPVVNVNTGITVNEGDVLQVILNTALEITDVDNFPPDLEYTITAAPTNGTLYNGVIPLVFGSNFTQADINSSAIQYTHDGSETVADFFRFTVVDGVGGSLPVTQFDITINPVNDAPVFTSSPVLTGSEGVLYVYNIAASDSDHPGAALSYAGPTLPFWLVLNDHGDGTADLSGIPPNGVPRLNPVSISVSDGVAAPVLQNFTIVVSYDIVIDGGGGGDYLTIQAGINASINGDIISVLAGTYNENIDFLGKDIIINGNEIDPSQVIIDGGNSGPCVTFENNEPATAIFNGFTLTNGAGRLGLPSTFSLHAPGGTYYGGGIFCYQSDPTLQNLFVQSNNIRYESNHGSSGAGIYIGNNSNVTIEGTVSTFRVENNTSEIYRGGGICIDNSIVTISNTDIQNNSGGNYGGGIAVYNSTLDLTNVNVLNNTAIGPNGRGGGIYDHTSNVIINIGVIIAGNSATTAGADNTYSFH